jgi:siroheme synthase
VVRLKAGDPCVFGRGGEEVETLRAHGIDVTVIPGITSALSAPLSVGISLTMRGEADRIHILTGHGAEGAAVSMPQFEPHTSYVWLMSVGRLEAVVQGMLDRGAPESWPAALVERATRPGQRAVRAPLAHLPDLVADRGLAAPAVLVISPTVARAEGAAFEADLLAETRAELHGLDNPVLLRLGRSF